LRDAGKGPNLTKKKQKGYLLKEKGPKREKDMLFLSARLLVLTKGRSKGPPHINDSTTRF